MIIELMEVILYVDDMAAAVAFYRDVLGLPIAYPHCDDYSQEHWVAFETGTCRLCLHGGGQRHQGADAPKVVFRVNDLDDARSCLLEKGVRLTDVRTPSPGVFVCGGVDPAGNPFSIEQS